jgi:Mg2+-importing ATPase
VADIVMLDHDLDALHEGVLEGRRTFGNVMKYIMMGTSSNFGNMLSMAGASLALPFLPMLPTQILLNNILYDLSQTAVPLDRVDRRDLSRPRSFDMRFIRRYMLAFGLLSSLFDALTFWILLVVLQADASQFRTGWFTESLVSQVLVIFVIRTRRRPWASRPAPALAIVALAIVAAGLLLPFTPLGALVAMAPLTPPTYGWITLLVFAYLGLAEAAKHLFYRYAGRQERA